YASLCPEHARASSTADRVFTGAFAPAMLKEMGFPPRTSASDDFAMPDCSLLATFSSIPVLTSRGCPNRCPYCASHLLYGGFEQCDPDAVVRAAHDLYTRTGARDFALYDDALLINADEHFIPLARGLIRLALPLRLHVPNGLHVRHITAEIAQLLKAAGCATIRLGFESADESLQVKTGGKVSNDDYLRAARALLDAGFTREQVGVYILAGLPGQRAEQIARSIRFVHDSGLRPFVSEYSPIPGTAMWDEAVKASLFPIAGEPLLHNNSLLPCRSEHCTTEDVHLLKRFARRPDAPYLC
ncbi:MAG: radical SAM protein, partial [Deltaproteobacteria bacterium]|nr:radical SAM protein [Deltaproteobacteria bacterium]